MVDKLTKRSYNNRVVIYLENEMATYTVLYQIKQHDLIKDRNITIKATTWQQAVDKVKAKIKDLHKIEQVATYHEDEHGGWFENYYSEQSFLEEQGLTKAEADAVYRDMNEETE